MASPRVLVVDSDRSSLGLLTHGMNRFGLTSSGVADLEEARVALASQRPDVVVSEVDGGSGLKVLEEIRRNPATREIPVVLLAKGPWARRRAHARELGSLEKLIAKPAYVQDIAVLTWLYAGRDASDDLFAGNFGEPSCAALLRGLLAGGRTGALRLEPSQATVRFREGAIVDAVLPPLAGERALMRILTLGTGSYELTFGPLEVKPTMQFELADLAGRGLSHVQHWQDVRSQLEPLDQVLTVDYGALATQLSDLPAGLWSLLRLFDGRRSIAEVIEDSALDDLTTGRAVAKLKALKLFEHSGAPSVVGRANGVAQEALSVPESAPAQAPQTLWPPVEEDLPPLASEPEAARPAALRGELHAGIERSFFDSPHEEESEEAAPEPSRARAKPANALRLAFWGAAALALAASTVILWKGTPGADVGAAPEAKAAPPQVVAAPAEATPPVPAAAEPAAVASAAPEIAALALPVEANPKLNALLTEGQSAYDRGQFPQAMASFEQASALAPEDAAVQLARGLTLYELDDLDHSAAALSRVLELDPKNSRAELLLGAIAEERGQLVIARQHYKRYLELDPKGEHAAETERLLANLGE